MISWLNVHCRYIGLPIDLLLVDEDVVGMLLIEAYRQLDCAQF